MISPLANVSPKAKIGNNVTIEPFATVYEDVVIGDNTYIHPNAIIYPDTTIGNNCQIFPGALIGIVSQDLKYKGEKAKLPLEITQSSESMLQFTKVHLTEC